MKAMKKLFASIVIGTSLFSTPTVFAEKAAATIAESKNGTNNTGKSGGCGG